LRERGATQIVLSTADRNDAGQRLFASMGFKPTMVEMTLQL
jgi:ribosomal protein S18 acetylase RimI-like enzyme